MSAESWQTTCPRCGWANSGAERRCMKCGQPLRIAPGLLVAGQSASSAIAPAAQPKTPRLIQPGGFFPRLIAIIIDTLILGVVAVPVVYLFVAQTTPTHVTPTGQSNPFLDQLKGLTGSTSQYTPEQLTQLLQLIAGIGILLLFYYVGTWSILGGSPGQVVMSLRIVDGSATTIGFGRALLRYIMKGFFGWLSPVSALMVAFGKDKRAIHDLLAGTLVIQFLDPKLADFDSVQPPAEAAPLPAGPAMPPVTSGGPQEIYAGAALAAAPPSPPQPAAPAPPGGGAPITPAALVAPAPAPPMAPAPPAAPAPPTAPAAPDQSAFQRYASPGEPPSKPTPAPGPDLPVFPTSEPGGYQPMAPAPPAPAPAPPVPAPPLTPADPGSGAPRYQPPTQPRALPFDPQTPTAPEAPPQPDPPADA